MQKIPSKIFTKVSILLLLSLFLANCTALRSGRGLSKGELNVSYVAPAAGNIRYGITDNIETRLNAAGSQIGLDLYFHTHSDKRKSNFGITFGGSRPYNTPEEEHQKPGTTLYGGFTADYMISEHFTPYFNVSLVRFYDENPANNWFYSIGAEITFIPKGNRKFIITPEITIPSNSTDIFPIMGAIGFGFTFDL